MDHNMLSLIIVTVKVLLLGLHGALVLRLVELMLCAIKEAKLRKVRVRVYYMMPSGVGFF